MLSTGFTKNSSAVDLVQFARDTMADTLNAELLTNTRVTAIDTTGQTLSLDGDDASQRRYSKLVLALGADVNSPPMEGDAQEKIFSINDLDDYARFRAALDKTQAQRICVIGAGLIGCEYTNDLLNGGYELQVVDALSTCLPTLVPETAGKAIRSSLEAAGVEFRFGTIVNGVYQEGRRRAGSPRKWRNAKCRYCGLRHRLAPQHDPREANGNHRESWNRYRQAPANLSQEHLRHGRLR